MITLIGLVWFMFLWYCSKGSIGMAMKIIAAVGGLVGLAAVARYLPDIIASKREANKSISNPELYRKVKEICRCVYISSKDKEFLAKHLEEIFILF